MAAPATTPFAIRPASAADIAALPAIESRARLVLYGMAGLGAIAELPPIPIERLRRGPCWVADDGSGKILGFALADRLDRDVVLETLSILPEFSRGGLGRALVDAVKNWAQAASAASLLVCTYRDIPWDAPFFVRLGFVEVPHRKWTVQMHCLQRKATAIGHDPARRLWMRLPLI
jgi:GNAT superfamily N-acetyltransferase